MPGIVLWCDTGLYQSFNRQRENEAPRNPEASNGGRGRNIAPEPKRRVNLPMVPPLSRLLCILSCRSKKVWPRWQALAESRLKKKTKGSNRGTITTSKYHPICKQSVFCPLAPSVTCGDSSLPEGAMGCVALHIGFQLIDSANCESLRHAFGVPAPFSKGAFLRPVSFYCTIPGFYRLSIDSVGKK